jgi:hypothetical protein
MHAFVIIKETICLLYHYVILIGLFHLSAYVKRSTRYGKIDGELLARSQYSEGHATGHLDTGFSWFPCVYKQMLRWLLCFQVATTCFSRNAPGLKLDLSVTSSIYVYIFFLLPVTTTATG